MKFEESVKKIDEIIAALENSDITLEDSIKLYKDGAELISSCRKELDNAEMLVTVADSDF
ncbi:MAG: exodeoxyribonuclease VII small subunit [Oscillospiraceae bacterium]|nr:exodeoxyribonuclease VII small subunit [Oscillospiraceae bacterium]